MNWATAFFLSVLSVSGAFALVACYVMHVITSDDRERSKRMREMIGGQK